MKIKILFVICMLILCASCSSNSGNNTQTNNNGELMDAMENYIKYHY